MAIDGLTSGETYKFKYRAQNIHGWSNDYSTSVSVKTLTEPSAPQVPSTVENGDQVRIRWVKPYSGGFGVLITEYEIQIKLSNGNYAATPDCNGQMNEIIEGQQCDVPVTTLISDFGLSLGDLVVARVRARNEKGFG